MAIERQRERNDEAFERHVARSRREIQIHCYRMLGSLHDAEDAAQEALLQAWRGRRGFEGRSSFRAWLYRIATNVCLRALERRGRARRLLPESHAPATRFEPLGDRSADLAWLDPFPTAATELARDPAPGPDVRYEQHEAVRLAFVAAIQWLPPRQRAALLLRDVVGLSGEETAASLDTSVPAANSALQRARATLQRRQGDELATVSVGTDARAQALLERYTRAWEAADVDALIGLLASDARWSMPPWPEWYVGRDSIADFLGWAWRSGGGRLIPTVANGQPAFGYYRLADDGWRPFAIQVLSLRGDQVAAITNFVEPALFASFGLPDRLPANHLRRDR